MHTQSNLNTAENEDSHLSNSLITLESCHLCLLCALAYFEDGVISKDELNYLIDKADKIIVKKPDDRELYIKEQIADFLDLLKSELDGQRSNNQSLTEVTAAIITDIIENLMKTNTSELDTYLNLYYGDFEEILSINKKVSKSGYEMLTLIRKKFNVPSSSGLNLASVFVILSAGATYYLLYLLVSNLF